MKTPYLADLAKGTEQNLATMKHHPEGMTVPFYKPGTGPAHGTPRQRQTINAGGREMALEPFVHGKSTEALLESGALTRAQAEAGHAEHLKRVGDTLPTTGDADSRFRVMDAHGKNLFWRQHPDTGAWKPHSLIDFDVQKVTPKMESFRKKWNPIKPYVRGAGPCQLSNTQTFGPK